MLAHREVRVPIIALTGPFFPISFPSPLLDVQQLDEEDEDDWAWKKLNEAAGGNILPGYHSPCKGVVPCE